MAAWAHVHAYARNLERENASYISDTRAQAGQGQIVAITIGIEIYNFECKQI